MALVLRDPFARLEIHRESVEVSPSRTCDWCGEPRIRHGKNRLFRYRTEFDSGRMIRPVKLFDGIDCMRQYHNL